MPKGKMTIRGRVNYIAANTACRAVVLALVLALAGGSLAFAQSLITVTSKPGRSGQQILFGGTLWLRLRGPNNSAAAAQAVVSRATQALFAGVTADKIQVRPAADRTFDVWAGPYRLITATRAAARAQRSSPRSLADRWAKRLKELLKKPYATVERIDRLDVPVGEQRFVRIGGPAAGSLKAAVSPADLATASVEGTRLMVTSLEPGDGVLAVSLGPRTLSIPLRMRHLAATVPSAVTAPLTAPLDRKDWESAARAALSCAMQVRKGGRVDADFSFPKAGDATATVYATAPDCFPVRARVQVDSGASDRRVPLPRRVWVSNYPERVTSPRCLLRDRLDGIHAVRLLWHHVNASDEPLWFSVRLSNLSQNPTSFAWTESASGPGTDEVYAGHVAARDYLSMVSRGAAVVCTLPPRSWVELGSIRTSSGQLVSGVCSLSLVDGGPLVVEVDAEADHGGPGVRTLGDRLDKLTRLTPFDFPGVVEKRAEYRVGSPWRFINIGKLPASNHEGKLLHGSYGVFYWVDLEISNPTSAPADVELAAHGIAGPARLTLLVEGHVVDTPLLGPGSYYVIERWPLAPGQSRRIVVGTMPEAGSNYPVALILRTPPGK